MITRERDRALRAEEIPLAHTADHNHGNTIITYDANNTITLRYVLKANLVADISICLGQLGCSNLNN